MGKEEEEEDEEEEEEDDEEEDIDNDDACKDDILALISGDICCDAGGSNVELICDTNCNCCWKLYTCSYS